MSTILNTDTQAKGLLQVANFASLINSLIEHVDTAIDIIFEKTHPKTILFGVVPDKDINFGKDPALLKKLYTLDFDSLKIKTIIVILENVLPLLEDIILLFAVDILYLFN